MVGPLVVAGVSVSRRGEELLKEIGVRDSKSLSPRRREHLYGEILKVSERVHWEEIPPGEIDRVVRTGRKYRKLNYLEAQYFARVIDELGAPRVTVDAADAVPERFGNVISDHLRKPCAVLSLHRADRNFAEVSAASIVAKVLRDRSIERLKDGLGDFGSGYPSDPATRVFFSERMRRGAPLPDFARGSWKTWARLQETLDSAF
ncbi:MAG: ribonuclease HII [archaeon]|nr:MAG: ribonuclease HII [archaeon]